LVTFEDYPNDALFENPELELHPPKLNNFNNPNLDELFQNDQPNMTE
jgi:hypothetical protein